MRIQIKENWNGYGAPAFTSTLLDIAKKIIIGLDHLPEVFPFASNGIQFEYDKPSGEYLEIEIHESKYANMFLQSKNIIEMFELDINDINKEVNKFFD